jgi:hypothetical protein
MCSDKKIIKLAIVKFGLRTVLFILLFLQVVDLNKIQSDLEELGGVMFGPSSPVRNFFQVKISPAMTRQRRVSQRIRVANPSPPTPRGPRTGSFKDAEATYESRDSQGTEDDAGERKKKTSLGDLIPRVSVFKGKSGKKSKGKIRFADDGDDDDGGDDDGDDDDGGGDDVKQGVYSMWNF